MKKGKILILYYHNIGYPLRKTNEENLYSFDKYSECYCYYVNLAFSIPSFLKNVKFDLIIYHYLLLCKRSLPKRLRNVMKKAILLKDVSGYPIATSQDEFIHTKLLSEFINEYGIKHIFSVAPESEWKKIYVGVDEKETKFTRVLTGYIDDESLNTISTLKDTIKERNIDIGYRATPLRYQLGTLGLLKYKIGAVFKENAGKYGLITDISTNSKDAILGTDWFKFLLKCKYTIGVESGASILDPEGNIQRSVEQFTIKNPKATFEETEKICFPKLNENLKLNALSPRHLECCMTRTCQVLIEGDYNNVLTPWKHYIPLKEDFSNLEEVLITIKTDLKRNEITNNAYKDIVESGKYSYLVFVKQVMEESLGKNYEYKPVNKTDLIYYKYNLIIEKILWLYIPLRSLVIETILKLLPKRIIFLIERVFD
jgi:hypothetical protein